MRAPEVRSRKRRSTPDRGSPPTHRSGCSGAGWGAVWGHSFVPRRSFRSEARYRAVNRQRKGGYKSGFEFSVYTLCGSTDGDGGFAAWAVGIDPAAARQNHPVSQRGSQIIVNPSLKNALTSLTAPPTRRALLRAGGFGGGLGRRFRGRLASRFASVPGLPGTPRLAPGLFPTRWVAAVAGSALWPITLWTATRFLPPAVRFPTVVSF